MLDEWMKGREKLLNIEINSYQNKEEMLINYYGSCFYS